MFRQTWKIDFVYFIIHIVSTTILSKSCLQLYNQIKKNWSIFETWNKWINIGCVKHFFFHKTALCYPLKNSIISRTVGGLISIIRYYRTKLELCFPFLSSQGVRTKPLYKNDRCSWLAAKQPRWLLAIAAILVQRVRSCCYCYFGSIVGALVFECW